MSTQCRQNLLFIVGAVLLGLSAAGMQLAKSSGWLLVIKKPLPIQKPLKDFNRDCLSPFRFVVSQQLPPETEEELGTKEYINWALDSAGSAGSWSGRLILSATYYTGKQDQIPHVPEECLYQGGFATGDDHTIDMKLDKLGEIVSVRRLSFFRPREVGNKSYVYYIICVNNDFFTERNRARFRMSNRRDTHLFYSKVELSFENVTQTMLTEVDECARKLLDTVLTELVKSHWPPKGSERGLASDRL